MIESPQRDWWVVADGRVVGLHLKSEERPEPMRAALDHGEELSRPYGMSILTIGTTWRSRALDHLEDMSCRRGACCRMREMTEEEQVAFVEAEQHPHPKCMEIMRCASVAPMANIQIRGVPEEVHRQLKSQAALAGQSLNEFLLARMTAMASLPTIPQLIEQIRARGEPYEGPPIADLIREDRDSR